LHCEEHAVTQAAPVFCASKAPSWPAIGKGGVCWLCAALLASTVGMASAQTTGLPSQPEIEGLRAILFSSVKTRSWKPTAPPSTDGLCADSAAADRLGGSKAEALKAPATAASRNLLVVPYSGDQAPHVDLDIRFPEKSDTPSKDSLKLIDSLASLLNEKEAQKMRFAIAGHTDSSGDEAINLRLSCARALAVRRVLLQKGIAPERLSAYGFGSAKPLKASDTAAAENRRVEVRKAD
jgi:outer membrane protein OmpA-like peptidoglycan-associated protein